MKALLTFLVVACAAVHAQAQSVFQKHGPLRVAASGTHLEHRDGTPFFLLADTCWTGPALSDEKGWKAYLDDRVSKGFTAIQFNIVSPWRTAPTDAEGNISYILEEGRLRLNEPFYVRLDQRMKAIREAGLLAMPVLCWGLKPTDAGMLLTEPQLTELCRAQVKRYASHDVLWILAGDNPYNAKEAAKWKNIGRAVFGADGGGHPLVTTHPTGQNFPWNDWDGEKWLTVIGYQSGHGDGDKTLEWIVKGPAVKYGLRKDHSRPVINLEPCYEGHNGYQSRKPHDDASVRRAIYWSLLVHPTAGVTYGGHGVWSWHTKPGQEPTDHKGSGVAKVWSEAIDLPAAKQLIHLRRIFDSVAWHQLRPAQELLASQPGDKEIGQYIAVAAGEGRKEIVAYLPRGGTLAFKEAGLAQNARIEWCNPRTGERLMDRASLTSPDGQDWVVILRR